jgi:hypothetical protein
METTAVNRPGGSNTKPRPGRPSCTPIGLPFPLQVHYGRSSDSTLAGDWAKGLPRVARARHASHAPQPRPQLAILTS